MLKSAFHAYTQNFNQQVGLLVRPQRTKNLSQAAKAMQRLFNDLPKKINSMEISN